MSVEKENLEEKTVSVKRTHPGGPDDSGRPRKRKSTFPFLMGPILSRSVSSSSSTLSSSVMCFSSSIRSAIARSSASLPPSNPSLFERNHQMKLKQESHQRFQEVMLASTSTTTPTPPQGLLALDFRHRTRLQSISPEPDFLVYKRKVDSLMQPGDDLHRKLEIASQARSAPPPRQPTLPEFNRLTLKSTSNDRALREKRRVFRDNLNEEEEARLQKVLNVKGVINEMPGAQVTAKDLMKLVPREWLNDEIINFYGGMVMARSNREQMKGKDKEFYDVHVFSSFFYTKLSSKTGYDGVRRWTKKVDIFSKDILWVPINVSNTHWVIAAINLHQKRFEFYDSMGHKDPIVFQNLRMYLNKEHMEKKKKPFDLSDWVDYCDPDTPQQKNGFDCGVFTAQAMECLSRIGGVFDYGQINMPYIRRKMMLECAEGKLISEPAQRVRLE